MSSKKNRKYLRRERIRLLCPQAVWIHYKNEEDRLFLDELEKCHFPYGSDLAQLHNYVELARIKYFGYAHARYQEWWMGFTKLNATAFSNGKVHAKDIIISEIK